MKKILIPVDFSGSTDIACTYALELAKNEGGLIRVFHSYFDQVLLADSSFPDSIDVSTMYNEELLKEVFHQSEKKMDTLLNVLDEKIKKNGWKNIRVESSLVGGEIESELKASFKEFNPDFVVMGTRGAGMTLNLWGRVSTHLINNSKIPVLTVPEIKHFKGFQTIMLATDLSGNDEKTINRIFSMFSDYNFKLHCIHFLVTEFSEEEKVRMSALKKGFSEDEKAGRIKFLTVNAMKDKQSAVQEYVESESIDLIAFQPQKHKMLYNLFSKNITRKNLQVTNIPLLALPQ